MRAFNLAAAPMCAEAFLATLEGSKPRPEQTFRLYRLSPKGTWEDDLFRGRNDRRLRLAIVAGSSSAPEATWPELERARRFMPKILILALCGRCNLLIPVFCTGLELADWVVA